MIFGKIRNPILFQGSFKKKHYFEGWYYKHATRDEKCLVSFIPGISTADNDPHSFVQYILVSIDKNGNKTMKTGYVKYALEAFKYSSSPFMIRVAENIFSESKVSVKLSNDKTSIEGDLKLGSFTPIGRSILMPNIMGFFAYLPKMQCYHGIVSMNHSVAGILKINGEETDFSNGKGYIEKDWGTSFPKKYIWIQCNNFKNNKTSVVVSIADIPFMNKSFSGYLCNLCVEGKEYRFATYNNSRIKIEKLTDENVIIALENRQAVIRIEADIKQQGELIAPQMGKMETIIKEGLSGRVRISLYNKKSKIIYEDTGLIAGIEIVGY